MSSTPSKIPRSKPGLPARKSSNNTTYVTNRGLTEEQRRALAAQRRMPQLPNQNVADVAPDAERPPPVAPNVPQERVLDAPDERAPVAPEERAPVAPEERAPVAPEERAQNAPEERTFRERIRRARRSQLHMLYRAPPRRFLSEGHTQTAMVDFCDSEPGTAIREIRPPGDAPNDAPGDTPKDAPGDTPKNAHGDTPGDTPGYGYDPDGAHGGAHGDTPGYEPDGAHGGAHGDTPGYDPDGAHGGYTPGYDPNGAHGDTPIDTPIDTPGDDLGGAHGGAPGDAPDDASASTDCDIKPRAINDGLAETRLVRYVGSTIRNVRNMSTETGGYVFFFSLITIAWLAIETFIGSRNFLDTCVDLMRFMKGLLKPERPISTKEMLWQFLQNIWNFMNRR